MVEFGQREDDIYVATYMKSGTTLTQMILYQLTTDGNMEFRHINDVCPWPRNASFRNLKPANIPAPRILKTHDRYGKFEKDTKGRFICVIRDGMDLSVSLYHHYKNYNNPTLTFDQNFENAFVSDTETNWFSFTREWLDNKHGFPILYLKYEDIVGDFDGTMKKIVDFCGLKVTPEIIARTRERCSFEFMKKHEEKFGVERFEDKRVLDQFIRKGMPGEGKQQLTPQQTETFVKSYKKNLEQRIRKIGFAYEY